MLGYRFFDVTHSWRQSRRRLLLHPALIALAVAATAWLWAPAAANAQTVTVIPTPRGEIRIEATQQRREGDLYVAEGNVEIRFAGLRLRADIIELNAATGEAAARGGVRFEYENQTVEAAEGRYNIRTNRGSFRNVRGSIQAQRRPNPNVLLSQNPVSFEAREVERLDDLTYVVHGAWITVCEPGQPLWTFHAPRATIRMQNSVELSHANFRFFNIPVIYLPYATVPVGRKLRQSGFLTPTTANTTRKGFVLGEAFYWAPVEWADLTLGAELLSRRGWSQTVDLRVRPWENVRFDAQYFGVVDRGLPGPGGVRLPQGGHRTHFELDAYLPDNWRAAMDWNTLTSLTFRLAFSETFQEAVNSEVRSTAFVTNSFNGFNLGFAAANLKNFLSASPETAVVVRSTPGARFSSVDQSPWRRLPLYFGFHATADAAHRSDPLIKTADVVQRTEIAPRVSLPLRWGPWIGANTTYMLRTTRYGSQLDTLSGTVIGDSVRRTTGEVTVDLRPPSLARIWETRGETRWKHVVEPKVVYRYVDGVNDYGRFLRFDETDTLTDTNEVEYSLTQRLFRRRAGAGAEELITWRVTQKYYFDPTFGGAIVSGQRNVFPALYSLTPFAFADGQRRFSPIVSDFRITPGGRYDAQFRVDFDPVRSKMTALGTLLNMRPYRESYFTLAHFATQAGPVLQPLSNQIRAIAGWGDVNRPGLNGSFGFSYDVNQGFFQNQVAQVSLNGSCCGIAFEFRRLALGPVRTENQFRVALLIANIGTFGNLRRQEKIF